MEVDLRTDQTSYRATVPSGVSTGILQMHDGDKRKLLDKGILKAVVNINNIIIHKLLGMDVQEKAELDKLTVQTLDGTKNERGWSEVFPDIHLEINRQTRRQVFDACTFFQRDQWWKSCWQLLGVAGIHDW